MGVRTQSLRSSKLMTHRYDAGEDPMASMGNLMDVMLVFACGIMIALIAHYNVEIASDTPDLGEADVLEGELSSEGVDVSGNGSVYVELGTVYRDTETGELYVVSDEEDA